MLKIILAIALVGAVIAVASSFSAADVLTFALISHP